MRTNILSLSLLGGLAISACMLDAQVDIDAGLSSSGTTDGPGCIPEPEDHPAACLDGLDNDCDGRVDCEQPECQIFPECNDSCTYDWDGDGWPACDDCNDYDPNVYPGNMESCGDGQDNNCNGFVDCQDFQCQGAPECGGGCNIDADGDGWDACQDCNDNDPNVFPGNMEFCGDGRDNDCNGFTDCHDNQCQHDPMCGGCPDADGDGFTCNDCNDADPMTFPGAPEVCGDNQDNNCDGLVDEGCGCMQDLDGDGWDNCIDCDDSDPTVNPGAPELCGDNLDNNCDGAIDCADGQCAPDPMCAACVDADGDGVDSCSDCDDTNASIFPGAAELCDGLDNDCDGTVDNGC